jgi:hypothetical protein
MLTDPLYSVGSEYCANNTCVGLKQKVPASPSIRAENCVIAFISFLLNEYFQITAMVTKVEQSKENVK